MSKNKRVTEHRAHTRIPFDAQVRVASNGNFWEGKLLDISLKGVMMARPQNWPDTISGPYTLEVLLNNEAIITMRARVAHMGIERIGFCCTYIDLDSMTHLKRLIELNIGDQQQLNRELSSLS